MIDRPDGLHDDVAAYVLGALDDDEAHAFERHQESCELCRSELSRLGVTVELLRCSVEPVTPPPSLRRRVMHAVERDSRRSDADTVSRRLGIRRRCTQIGLPRLAAVVSVAAALLIGAGGGYAVTHATQGSATRTLRAQVDRQRLPTTTAKLVVEPGGAAAVLHLNRLRQAAPGHVYELWLERGARMIPAGAFDAAPDGNGVAGIAGSLKGVRAVFVTEELAPGTARPTTPPLVKVRV